MKNMFCQKCGMEHLMQIMIVLPLNNRFSVEYRCRQTGHSMIKIEDENPLNKKPSKWGTFYYLTSA